MNENCITVADMWKYLSSRYAIHKVAIAGEYTEGVRNGYAACMADIIRFVKEKQEERGMEN